MEYVVGFKKGFRKTHYDQDKKKTKAMKPLIP